MSGATQRRAKWKHAACALAAFCAAAVMGADVCSAEAADKPLTIRIDASKPVARFLPVDAFGGGLDGLAKGEVAKAYQPANVKEMAAAPFHRLSYRLRTELGVHVWHWNAEGTWSDPKNRQGYWTSSARLDKPILISHGYALPRRGNTHDQASDKGYSRLADGDETAFWKSNPYLDAHFTGEDNALHPQWLVIDFNEAVSIQSMRLLWGEPYATRYEVQYWDGEPAQYFNDLRAGVWRPFPLGQIEDGKGGEATLRLAAEPMHLRYVRILLKQSSGTAPTATNDVRDRLGFAIREIYAGVPNEDGELNDVVRHGTSAATQTSLLTSSTDPWHRASDLDPNIEQPGIDLVMTSGLTRGQPVLMPTGLIYDTPENAQAEIRYIKARGYNVTQIELGEEPDGQHVSPEHYGALFIQFAAAIRKVDPALKTGGPGFQSEIGGWNTMPDASGNFSWMNRFLAYLSSRGRKGYFNFFSFEWYPFDDMCKPPSPQLVSHPALVRQTLRRLAADGVPKNIPWIISEYGYSSFAGQSEVELPAALLNAEIAAQFLMAGVKTAYLYGIEPNVPIKELNECETWGNLMLFQADENGRAKWRLPAYYGAKLVASEWAGAARQPHDLFQAVADGPETGQTIAAYPVRRPGGIWALILLNKSDSETRPVRVQFDGLSGGSLSWRGPLEVYQYSPKHFAWKPGGGQGQPIRSERPEFHKLPAGTPAVITLPPMSLTVVRGQAPRVDRVSARR